VTDNLPRLLCDLLRVPAEGTPLSVIDLSGVPSDVVDAVVSVLCRSVFDFALWNPERVLTPILLVCEEAHRYAPRGDQAAFASARAALARIAKEGRKYGVGLALVSQRPSELSEAILSQCNTVIAMRMSNEQDQGFVRNALPDTVRSLAEALSALTTGEAIVSGEGTVVPARIAFTELPEHLRPRSSDVSFADAWATPVTAEIVSTAVERWRRQTRS
jgi:DNA helicase HerA-like ATPase